MTLLFIFYLQIKLAIRVSVQFVVGHVKAQFAGEMEERGCPLRGSRFTTRLYFSDNVSIFEPEYLVLGKTA
jgi:hypothetical protein